MMIISKKIQFFSCLKILLHTINIYCNFVVINIYKYHRIYKIFRKSEV